MQPEKPQILFVEDDAVFRQRVSRSLNARGYKVLEAETVDEARQMIAKHQPGYAILDLCVGEASGLTLIDSLKEVCGDVTCVVLTGYGTISTAVSALKAGATNYLTKPVHVGEILNALQLDVEDYLSESSQQHQRELPDIEQPTLLQVEWEHIQRVLEDCNGNVTHAATRLGVHRRTLQRKLSKIPTPLK